MSSYCLLDLGCPEVMVEKNTYSAVQHSETKPQDHILMKQTYELHNHELQKILTLLFW